MIEVTPTYEGKVDKYPEGKGWVIDDHRQLHVTSDKGNLGSYATGCWTAVRKVDEAATDEG